MVYSSTNGAILLSSYNRIKGSGTIMEVGIEKLLESKVREIESKRVFSGPMHS